jgi:hypothetical protein
MILLHDIIQIFHPADGDRRAMRFIVTPDRRGIGLAAINRHLLGHTVPVDGLGEKTLGRLLIALFREQEIDGLAALIAA